jgi:pimeloyl-ACP methyl ester carboxylesterase
VREGWLQHGAVRLHYLEWPATRGVQGPPLLLLHGLGSNARFWERLAAHLPHRRLVALDQRCHGLSDCPRGGYSSRTLAADVEAAITTLDLARPVVVGHSWGASIALDTTVRHPDLVAGMAQLDGGGTSFDELMTWEQTLQLMHRPMPSYTSLEEAVAAHAAELPGAWDADLEAFAAAGVSRRGRRWRQVLTMTARRQILWGMYRQRPAELWPKVQCPIFAGMGGAAGEGPFLDIKRQGVDRLKALVPSAEVHWYDGPHDFPLYVPGDLAADLDRFASRR